MLHVPPPNAEERRLLLQHFASRYLPVQASHPAALEHVDKAGEKVGSNLEVGNDVRGERGGAGRALLLKELEAQLRDGMSGAEVENLCREAALRSAVTLN